MSKQFEEIKESMLQAIAHAQGKPVQGTRIHTPSFEEWQVNEINRAIQEADAGDFVTDEEFAIFVKKYTG